MTIYDSLGDSEYHIVEGNGNNYSPNGLWKCQFAGNGVMGNFPGYHYQQPQISTGQFETHAALFLSTFAFNNATFSVDMKTESQLRQVFPPNAWETAWFFWNWTDNNHQYYCTLKTSGFEIGKVDPTQIFVFTSSSPKVNIGNWQTLQITATNMSTSTPHIKAVVDGVTVCDFDDTATPNDAAMQKGGFIGLYCEDARVNFRNVQVSPL